MGYKKLKDYEWVVFLGLSVDSLYNEEHLLTQTLHIEQNIAQSLPITELHNLNQGRWLSASIHALRPAFTTGTKISQVMLWCLWYKLPDCCIISVLYTVLLLIFVGKFVPVLLFLAKYFKLLLYCKIAKNLGWGFWNNSIYMSRFIFVWL